MKRGVLMFETKKEIMKDLLFELKEQNKLLDYLINKTSAINNNLVYQQGKHTAWISNKNQSKARELEMKDPELFEYIRKVLRLYFD